ncbi:hypothetical protein RIF29_19077 [Crotalaria pallida]|uniref:Uncharacterized protein n=1 Tax=Crotalaria pallida TaxID=3830 RepID=A0AAN9F771_CROPI
MDVSYRKGSKLPRLSFTALLQGSKLPRLKLGFFIDVVLQNLRQIISHVKKKRCRTFCRTCIKDGLWTKQSSPRRSVLLLSASATIGMKPACRPCLPFCYT